MKLRREVQLEEWIDCYADRLTQLSYTYLRDIKGKSLVNISGGEFKRTQSGSYAGVVYDNAFNQSAYERFPINFRLNVDIHQVGS